MSARKYFVYELKKALFAICSIALIMTAITVAAILTTPYSVRSIPESGIRAVVFMTVVLAAVVPIWMMSYRMKKRSVDLYYSLPLKRTQILRVKYLLGLIAVYAPYSVAFFLGALAAVIRYPSGAIAGEYYFAAYFAALPAIFCIYGIMSFVFTRAQRTLDGIVFVIFWLFAMFAVASVVGRFFDGIQARLFTPIAPLSQVSYSFRDYIELPNWSGSRYGDNYLVNMTIGFILTGLQAVAATVMLFVLEPKSKTENVGGVSYSPFGYKVMIPLLTICLFINIDMVGRLYSVLLAVIVACCSYMLIALYKHTFKIGKLQAIIFVSTIVLGIALSIAASYTPTIYY